MKHLSLVVAVSAIALVTAGPAAAHRQTVAPPGQDEPVILNDPISRTFAQAHCHAQSPAIVAGASGGVVVFTPTGHLDCDPILNPGGQTTGP
jgi:hypothetical protein